MKPGHQWERLIVRAGATSSGKTIETLLRYGAAINALDDPATSVDEVRGYTALHAAGWNGNADAAAVLVAHGADLSIRDGKYRATPAGWADYAGHAAVRDLILEGQIDVFEAIDFDLADRIPGILQRDPGALTRPFSEYRRLGQTHANWARSREVTPLAYAVEEKKAACAEVLMAQGQTVRAGARLRTPIAAMSSAWDDSCSSRAGTITCTARAITACTIAPRSAS